MYVKNNEEIIYKDKGEFIITYFNTLFFKQGYIFSYCTGKSIPLFEFILQILLIMY